MTQTRPVPAWGKTVGILMIIFGSLGAFFQIYKIIIPQLLRIQREVMDSMAQVEFDNQPNPFKMSQGIFDKYMHLTEAESNTLVICGIAGLIACVFYIIGGAKLLKATPANYQFGRAAAVGFLSLNIITVIALLSSGTSLLMVGILVYVILGLLIDLTLSIILLAADKSKYGIGISSDQDLQNYTRTSSDDTL